ncbi:MAG: hypothetical protein DRO94_00185 [Candidatus Altiarchaeales archaeon]|nr:MAG: hypothetical protein DRO95_00390 [Candidatus Altiarchaeales archaeon]RLI95535.1 MAG: hypothetical protein DRO94_00185 [Candidatus Altiarchaeales archaeon]
MEDLISFLNHWWREGKVKKSLALPYKRRYFNELQDLMKYRQIIIICGLRRVGKSTLMYQLIQYLIDRGVSPYNILYFSFDKGSLEIKKILDIYSKLTDVDYENENIFVFLDEIYKLKNWYDELKLLYDALPNVKFVISGSASLQIEEKARKNLTGRYFFVEIKPLNFNEFFELKFGKKIEKPEVWANKLKATFPIFMKRAFPEIIDWEEERAKEYVKELIIDKILFSDFQKVLKDADADLLQNLTEIFLSSPGMYLNLDSLSRDLGKSKNTLISHIKMLEFGYIIRLVKNYRGSMLSVSRKLKRVYPYHPSLITGIFREVGEENLAECFIRSYLDAELYWRKGNKEVDFVYRDKPIEIKYKDKISKEDIKGLLSFMRKFGVNKGYLISRDVEDIIKINRKEIEVIPIWKLAIRNFNLR